MRWRLLGTPNRGNQRRLHMCADAREMAGLLLGKPIRGTGIHQMMEVDKLIACQNFDRSSTRLRKNTLRGEAQLGHGASCTITKPTYVDCAWDARAMLNKPPPERPAPRTCTSVSQCELRATFRPHSSRIDALCARQAPDAPAADAPMPSGACAPGRCWPVRAQQTPGWRSSPAPGSAPC